MPAWIAPLLEFFTTTVPALVKKGRAWWNRDQLAKVKASNDRVQAMDQEASKKDPPVT